MKEAELKEMGREVASAMVKGAGETVRLYPSQEVPLVTLLYVTNEHNVTKLQPDEFKTLAKAMEEALEEAARWDATELT